MITQRMALSRIFFQSFRLAGKRTRRLVLASIVALSSLRVLDLVSLGLIFPIVGLLAGGTRVDNFSQWIPVDQVEGYTNAQLAAALSIVLAGLIIFKSVVSVGVTYWVGKVFNLDRTRITEQLFRTYLEAPASFHFEQNAATLLRNLNTSVPNWYNKIIQPIGGLVSDLFLALAIAGMLVFANPLAAAIAIVVIGVGALGFWWFSAAPMRELGAINQEANRAYNFSQLEALSAIIDIKVLDQYRYFIRRFRAAANDIARLTYLNQTYRQVPQQILEVVGVISVCGFVLIAYLGWTGDNIVPFIALFAASMLRLMPTVQRTVATLNDARIAIPAFAQIQKDMELFGDWFEPETVIRTDRDPQQVVRPSTLQENIVIANVSYHYESRNSGITDISFDIPAGASVGIVGPSGAGKSTLIQLLLGLIKPQSGEILFDGQPRPGEEAAIRRSMGYVPQNVTLLDDTLRRNIAFGLSDEEISDQALAAAIQRAELSDFVASLPNGVETVVGEAGVQLSGGQRQRVAIARALYFNSEILVLDEATSSLDVETESRITKTLRNLAGDKTLVIVAHRLSTLRSCDKLVFLKDGRLVGEGSFDQLKTDLPEFNSWAERANLGGTGAEHAGEVADS